MTDILMTHGPLLWSLLRPRDRLLLTLTLALSCTVYMVV
jgi:hypothetical protein